MKNIRLVLISLTLLLLNLKGLSQDIDYNKIILPQNTTDVSYEERLVQIAWKNNPRSRMALHEVRSAEYQAKAIGSEWSSFVSASFNFNEFNINPDKGTTNQFFPRYNFNIRLPLSLVIENPQKKKAALAQVDYADESYNLTKLEIRATVLRLYSDFKKNELIWVIKKQNMEDEESNYLFVEQKFKDGEVTIEEYMKAQRSRNAMRIELAISENEYIKSKVNLEEVLGVRLEDIK